MLFTSFGSPATQELEVGITVWPVLRMAPLLATADRPMVSYAPVMFPLASHGLRDSQGLGLREEYPQPFLDPQRVCRLKLRRNKTLEQI